MLSILGKFSPDDALKYFFLFFPGNSFDILCNLSLNVRIFIGEYVPWWYITEYGIWSGSTLFTTHTIF